MIVTKTPFRMSFVGGGSDIESFYKDNLGAVISTSINKYMYVCVNQKFDQRIRLNYSKTEDVKSPDEIDHPIVRECLKILNINNGIEISSLADIPSHGSGLGSSSSYAVGLLHALHAFSKNAISKNDLAELACEIEIIKCGEPIGKQDQYAASFGGLNYIEFNSNGSVSVNKIKCSNDTLEEIQSKVLVFYTGRARSASKVLADQSQNMLTAETKTLVRRMVELANLMRISIESCNLEDIGEQLNENWYLKKQLANGISDQQIDLWYDLATKAGASGGKLLGAGNGGFLMFYAPKSKHEKIIKALSDIQPVNIGFDHDGSKIIYNAD